MALPGPLTRYRQLVEAGGFEPDHHQMQAAEAVESLWQDLQRRQKPSLLDLIGRRPRRDVKGLYLWGGVGRGKTWLMDLFYDSLQGTRRQRVHFHRFMQRVHGRLRALGHIRDPLARVAEDWAARTDVLCLDEFFVTDIADAMLLAGLLEGLFRRGVTLVTTSNIEPEGLYRNGLQRSRFLPAIELIRQHLRVVHLAGTTDFRLRILERSEIFHCPLDAAADRAMRAAFERIAAECELNHDLEINGRSFHARRRGDGVIWFEFDELCEKPRGAVDYIEIARAFNTVVIGNVPQLREQDRNAARRLITLVDEFYDRNVKLLMSAEVPINELYTGSSLTSEFERTASRLTEMQSHDYLARPHLP